MYQGPSKLHSPKALFKSAERDEEGMRALCVTVDLDRDVNRAAPGRTEAVCGDDMCCRCGSSGEGAIILSELLDDLNIRGTFFAEAYTLMSVGASSVSGHEVALHGYDHEDFTGQVSGMPMCERDIRDVMERSVNTVKDVTGATPRGFRAPYMRAHDPLMSILGEYGIEYDSSEYASMGRSVMPYLKWGITEIPVPKGKDASGRTIAAYLWPMHEGNRGPRDYIEMASGMEEGVFVIATHTWHMVESIKGGMMDRARREKNLDDVRNVISSLIDSGYEPMTMEQAMGRFPPSGSNARTG
jgi:peptidoglycan/xylan/chitin deacetylase (PgdA/CDA1 family)